MTADDITRLTPLVEDLQARGIVATWSTTSWPMGGLANRDRYEHAFQIRGHRTVQLTVLTQLFTEDDVINALAATEARQNHGANVYAAYEMSREVLMRDLANVYRLRLLGKPVPVPSSVTIKDLVVPLS